MKKPLILLLAMFACIATIAAQLHHQGQGNRHQDQQNHYNNKIRHATMDDGNRIVLFPDGTWDFAIQQLPPLPPFTSEFWGPYLLVSQNGKEVDRVEYSYTQNYDRDSKGYVADISFGQGAYTFDENKREVRFLGKELIGNARQFSDAKDMAAYHYTTEIYDGLTAKFWGSYLIVYLDKKEIDRVRMSYQNNYDQHGKCYYGGISFGSANYQFSECDGEVLFLGNKLVGSAFKFDGAKSTAAFHYIREHYQGWVCR